MLMRRLTFARGDFHNDQVLELLVRPRHQVRQPSLLGRFTESYGQRIALPRIAMPANLQPGLLALVPAQQDPGRLRVHDQRGRGDVQRQLASPRIVDCLSPGPGAVQVCRLCVTVRPIHVQERAQ